MIIKIPYCTGFYTLESCSSTAKRLRTTGKYEKVWIGPSIIDKYDGDKYAQVWVQYEAVTK